MDEASWSEKLGIDPPKEFGTSTVTLEKEFNLARNKEMKAILDKLFAKDAEIERLQADLDVWHKTTLEIADMVVEAGRDPD